MSGSPKEKLHALTEEATETEGGREVYLRNGKKLVVSDAGTDQLVEVRSESGMVEVRILLTEQGPVLQMEAVRMQLKATEAVEIESARVDIKATEKVDVSAGAVKITAEHDIDVDAEGEVHVEGTMIYLN